MVKLDEFAIGEMNEIYKRYVFSRSQEGDESIDAYLAALHMFAQTCNFLPVPTR